MKFRFSHLIAFMVSCILWLVMASFIWPVQLPIKHFLSAVITFFNDNWIVLSLVLSELAALLPVPFNGIAHAVLKVLDKLILGNSNH